MNLKRWIKPFQNAKSPYLKLVHGYLAVYAVTKIKSFLKKNCPWSLHNCKQLSCLAKKPELDFFFHTRVQKVYTQGKVPVKRSIIWYILYITKKKTNNMAFHILRYIKYCKFWSISLEHFYERKPLISEECL